MATTLTPSSPKFVAGPPDQGVDGAGVAVDETAADGVWGIGGDDPRWFFFEVHAGELGCFGDERVQRDVEARQYGASEVACFAVHGLDGGRRPDIDDDRGEAVVPPVATALTILSAPTAPGSS